MCGGDSRAVRDQLRGVEWIQASQGAFAALAKGQVVTWGDPYHGGDSREVQDQLQGVQAIQASGSAFTAVLADATLVTWGENARDRGVLLVQ